MTTIKKVSVTEFEKEVLRDTSFSSCPCCGVMDLLKFESDHFCMSCDWSSVLHDVNSGNFEKRIGLLAKNRTRNSNSSADVIYLSDRVGSASCPAQVKLRKP